MPDAPLSPPSAGRSVGGRNVWLFGCSAFAMLGLAGLFAGSGNVASRVTDGLPAVAGAWTGRGETIAEARASRAPVIGDEGFWLSSQTSGKGAAPTPAVLGDQISIAGKDHVTHLFEIVAVKPVVDEDRVIAPASVTSEPSAKLGPRLLLVTCKEVGLATGVIRFVVEATPEAAAGSAPKPLPSAL